MDNWKYKVTLFLMSQGISLFGSSIVTFAISWYVTLETGSGALLTISVLVSFIPQILVSLYGGALADKYNRKTIIIVSDALIALSTLILAIIFISGFKNIWILFIVSAVRSIGAGLQYPAVGAVLPQFVPADKLMRVNTLNSTITSISMLLAPVLGGAVFATLGIEAAMLIDVFTAIIGIFILSFLKVDTVASEDTSINEGVLYIKNNKLIRNVIILYAVLFTLVTPSAFLTPLLISRMFGDEVWRLTANEVFYSIGAISGGLIMSMWQGYKNRLHTLAFSCVGFGISTYFLGVSNTFVFYIFAVFIAGIFLPFFTAAENVFLQETVPNEILGRVLGVISIISACAMPLGMLIFGPISDFINIKYVFILTGIALILLVIPFIKLAKLNQTVK